jgi:hypothetical protein
MELVSKTTQDQARYSNPQSLFSVCVSHMYHVHLGQGIPSSALLSLPRILPALQAKGQRTSTLVKKNYGCQERGDKCHIVKNG